jgi:hypothetical protein
MRQENRKRLEIHRMQPVLVDAEGQVWSVASPFFWMRPRQPDGNILGYAVTKLGFVHIWPVDGSSVVVSLQPDLVHPKTLAATFYAIADLRPLRVYISATDSAKQRWELFDSVDRALKRIDRLVTAARRAVIAARLLRAWANRRKRYAPPHWMLPRVRCLARPRPGRPALLSIGMAAAFLTRLVAVSSLSFLV